MGPEGVTWELEFAHFQCWEWDFFLNATGSVATPVAREMV